jgi:hypothetical protein
MDNLLGHLPPDLDMETRHRCLISFHTAGTDLLRRAVKLNDRDMVKDVAETLRNMLEHSTEKLEATNLKEA